MSEKESSFTLQGIVNVLKPPGMTSHDVVQYLRRLLRVKRIGHAGTLDPGATGVLVVAVGQATRLIEFAMNSSKYYRAEMVLGVTTDTQDAFGKVTRREEPGDLSAEDIATVLDKFHGRVQQVPPMVSAVRYRGRKLYELARQGQEVPREPRWVEIHEVKLRRWEPPRAVFDVCCSKGTYIRTLCADAGDVLGCGAHLSFLVRTRSGSFRLEEAQLLEEIAEAVSKGEYSFLQDMEKAVSNFPPIHVKASSVERVLHGNPLRPLDLALSINHLEDKQWVRIHGPASHFLAIGQVARSGVTAVVNIKKVFGA